MFLSFVFRTFIVVKQLKNNELMLNLKTYADEISYCVKDPKQIQAILFRVYEEGHKTGYKHGTIDVRRIMSRVKFRYILLNKWFLNQISELSSYTKRYEYKMIMDDIESASNQFSVDNYLNSAYKPTRTFTYKSSDLDIEESYTLTEALNGTLPDCVGNFIKAEEARRIAADQKNAEQILTKTK